MIAARHPERFAEVERLCRQEGLSTARRTELPIDDEPRVDAVILDTIGELAHLYQIATAVFVGGSIVPAGGHNILEPAAHGKAIVFGPHMENFSEIAETFLANDAAVQRAERARAGGGAAEPDGRSRAARAPGRGGAGAGRGQPRRQGQDAGRHRRRAAADRAALGAWCVPSAWSIEHTERPLRACGHRAPRVVQSPPAHACGVCRTRSSASAIWWWAAAARRRWRRSWPASCWNTASGPPSSAAATRAASAWTAWWWSATGTRCWKRAARAGDEPLHAGARAAGRAGARVRRPLPGRAVGASPVRHHRVHPGRRLSAPAPGARRGPAAREPRGPGRDGVAIGPLARAAGGGHGRAMPWWCRARPTTRRRVSALLGVGRAFAMRTRVGRPVGSRTLARDEPRAWPWPASPGRSASSTASSSEGWRVAERIVFPDHHWFTAADLARVDAAARTAARPRPC